MRRCATVLAVGVLGLLAATGIASAQPRPPHPARSYDAGKYERRLERLGALLVTSIVARASGPSPVRRPRDIEVFFGWEATGRGPWKPMIAWEANCNEYFYRLRATAHCLHLGLGGSTLVGCFGPIGDEDSWIDGFFRSDPSWRIRGRHLILTSSEWRMTLLQPRPLGGAAPVVPAATSR